MLDQEYSQARLFQGAYSATFFLFPSQYIHVCDRWGIKRGGTIQGWHEGGVLVIGVAIAPVSFGFLGKFRAETVLLSAGVSCAVSRLSTTLSDILCRIHARVHNATVDNVC